MLSSLWQIVTHQAVGFCVTHPLLSWDNLHPAIDRRCRVANNKGDALSANWVIWSIEVKQAPLFAYCYRYRPEVLSFEAPRPFPASGPNSRCSVNHGGWGFTELSCSEQLVDRRSKMAGAPARSATSQSGKMKKDESFLGKLGGTLVRKKKSKEGNL